MKKISAILLAVFIVSSVISCKPREKCPAYGKTTIHTPVKKHA